MWTCSGGCYQEEIAMKIRHRSLRHVILFTAALAIMACTLGAQSSAPSREAWQRPDDIVAALELSSGPRVADVEPKMVETLKQPAQKEKLPT
jgi:hypothetical protein